MKPHQYERRVTALQSKLKEQGVDSFVSVCPADNAYLTGFLGSTSLLLATQDRVLLLCDFRYAEQATKQVEAADVVRCSGSLDKQLATFVADMKLEQLAFEPDAMTVARKNAIENSCKCEMIGMPDSCRSLRLCKEPGEIDRIGAAAALAEAALEAMLTRLEPGIPESVAAGLLELEFRKRGAQGASFDTIVLFGERSSLPHGKPGDRPLQRGDIVLVDCGCILDGYCSDLTRTFVYGSIPGDWFSEIYETTHTAQEAAVKTVNAGVRACDVDAAARSVIAAAGYGDNFGHGTGHGVGLEVHEPPRLSAESDDSLEAGMVVTAEPGIYLSGQGGVRIEDLLVVTETGNVILTRLPKELRIL